MNKINSTFITCGALSLIGVGLSTFTAISLPLGVISELAPLVWYFHCLLRIARHDSLGQTAIDSIYYFGFLITIFSLAASVFHIFLHGVGNDVESLISHFGVGLLATGLALAFRMWLTAVAEQLSKKDLDETIESYIRRVDDVVAKVEMSAASFEGLSESLQEHTKKVCLDASDSFGSAMTASTKMFRDRLEELTREGAGAVQLFSATVKQLSLAEHVTSFDQNMIVLSHGLKAVVSEIGQAGSTVLETAQEATAKALSDTVSAHAKGLAQLTARSKAAMDEILAGVDDLDFTDDAGVIREHMQSLSTTVTNITKKFGAIEEKLEGAVVRQSAETVRLILEGFAAQFGGIAASVENESLERTQAILSNMAKATSASLTAARMDMNRQFNEDLVAAGAHFAKARESATLATADQFTQLADAAEDARDALSGSADEIRRVVLEVKNLEARISAFQPAKEIDDALEKLERIDAAVRVEGTATRGFPPASAGAPPPIYDTGSQRISGATEIPATGLLTSVAK